MKTRIRKSIKPKTTHVKRDLVASLRSEIKQLKATVLSLQSARSSPKSPLKSPLQKSPLIKSPQKSPAWATPRGWKRHEYTVPLNPRHVEWNTHGPGNLVVSEWREHRRNPWWVVGGKSPASILHKRSSKHVKRERTWENNKLEKAFQEHYMNQQLQSLRNHGAMKSKGLREVAKPMNIN